MIDEQAGLEPDQLDGDDDEEDDDEDDEGWGDDLEEANRMEEVD